MRNDKAVLATGTAVLLFVLCTPVVSAEDHSEPDPVFLRTVPGELLQAERGKAVLTIMDVDGTVHDNVARNVVTGRNVITSGSFANASGVTTTIQNSGNNVLIQHATILQLDVR